MRLVKLGGLVNGRHSSAGHLRQAYGPDRGQRQPELARKEEISDRMNPAEQVEEAHEGRDPRVNGW